MERDCYTWPLDVSANRWLLESRRYIYWNLLDTYWIVIDIYWNVINIILESGAMVYQRLLLGIAQAVPCKSPWQNMAPWHLAWFLQSGGAMVVGLESNGYLLE